MTTVRTEYTWAELGALLRSMRTHIGSSLEVTARQVGVDKSTLSRWERGGTTIPVAHAKRLDAAYRGEGVIATAILGASTRPWRPAPSDRPQSVFAHAWPASHSGQVWLSVVPSDSRLSRDHQLTL